MYPTLDGRMHVVWMRVVGVYVQCVCWRGGVSMDACEKRKTVHVDFSPCLYKNNFNFVLVGCTQREKLWHSVVAVVCSVKLQYWTSSINSSRKTAKMLSWLCVKPSELHLQLKTCMFLGGGVSTSPNKIYDGSFMEARKSELGNRLFTITMRCKDELCMLLSQIVFPFQWDTHSKRNTLQVKSKYGKQDIFPSYR